MFARQRPHIQRHQVVNMNHVATGIATIFATCSTSIHGICKFYELEVVAISGRVTIHSKPEDHDVLKHLPDTESQILIYKGYVNIGLLLAHF